MGLVIYFIIFHLLLSLFIYFLSLVIYLLSLVSYFFIIGHSLSIIVHLLFVIGHQHRPPGAHHPRTPESPVANCYPDIYRYLFVGALGTLETLIFCKVHTKT